MRVREYKQSRGLLGASHIHTSIPSMKRARQWRIHLARAGHWNDLLENQLPKLGKQSKQYNTVASKALCTSMCATAGNKTTKLQVETSQTLPRYCLFSKIKNIRSFFYYCLCNDIQELGYFLRLITQSIYMPGKFGICQVLVCQSYPPAMSVLLPYHHAMSVLLPYHHAMSVLLPYHHAMSVLPLLSSYVSLNPPYHHATSVLLPYHYAIAALPPTAMLCQS